MEKAELDWKLVDWDRTLQLFNAEIVEHPRPEEKYETIRFLEGEFIGRWISYWKPTSKVLQGKSFQVPDFGENIKIEIFQGK